MRASSSLACTTNEVVASMGIVAVGGEAEAAAPAILRLYATIACQDRMGSQGVRGAGAGARGGYTPCTRNN